MGRTDTAARLVPAPPASVWEALTSPDALVVWLPPDGMTGRFESFDLRPGGGYRLVLTYRDPADSAGKATADSDVVDARFVVVEAGSRLVQEVDFVSDDPRFAGTMTMTWTLRAAEGGTLVEIRADDVPPGISAEDHVVGMASSLANLAAYVAR